MAVSVSLLVILHRRLLFTQHDLVATVTTGNKAVAMEEVTITAVTLWFVVTGCLPWRQARRRCFASHQGTVVALITAESAITTTAATVSQTCMVVCCIPESRHAETADAFGHNPHRTEVFVEHLESFRRLCVADGSSSSGEKPTKAREIRRD
jgi:hypothetical protein